jgi:hypothetical protein
VGPRDDHPDDADLVRKVAAELIARHGILAPRVALKHEEKARRQGHRTDADTWLEIAGAAAELLGGKSIMGEVLKFLRRLR